MLLSDVSIRRPVFTAMMSLCLIVLGVMGFSRLGTDLFPDVVLPRGGGHHRLQGRGPGRDRDPGHQAHRGRRRRHQRRGQDPLLEPRERRHGGGAVQAVRQPGPARCRRCATRCRRVANKLPQDADTPMVGRVDISAVPVLTYAASANADSRTVRKLIEDKLKPALAQLEGVADVRINGGDVREIQVDIDLDKARAVGVSPLEVAQRIGMENLDLPAGRLQLGPTELTVRSLGQFKSVDELRAAAGGPEPHGRPGAAGRGRHRHRRRGRAAHHGAPQRQGRRHPRGRQAAGLQHRGGERRGEEGDGAARAHPGPWLPDHAAHRPVGAHPRERPRGVDRPRLRRRDGGAHHPDVPAGSARHLHLLAGAAHLASSARSS